MFKPKAHRAEDGSYTLTFGKGAKKLTSRLDQMGGRWEVTGMFTCCKTTKREAIEAWGTWAAASYAGTAPHTPQTEDEGESEGGGAPPAEDDDELSQWQRDFFDTLSKKHGRLSEWQRAQIRCTLRELLGEKNANAVTKPAVKVPPVLVAGAHGPGRAEKCDVQPLPSTPSNPPSLPPHHTPDARVRVEGAGSGEAQGTDGHQDEHGTPASVPSGPGAGGLPKMPPAHRPVLLPPARPDHS